MPLPMPQTRRYLTDLQQRTHLNTEAHLGTWGVMIRQLKSMHQFKSNLTLLLIINQLLLITMDYKYIIIEKKTDKQCVKKNSHFSTEVK